VKVGGGGKSWVYVLYEAILSIALSKNLMCKS
jgi:hypothetical protein